jgi:hypothetical protein
MPDSNFLSLRFWLGFKSNSTDHIEDENTTFLGRLLLLWTGVLLEGSLIFTILVYFVPNYPILLFRADQPYQIFNVLICIVEGYMFTLGAGFTITNSILMYIMFKGHSNCFKILNQNLNDRASLSAKTIHRYVCSYRNLQCSFKNIVRLYSKSLLGQELNGLTVIVLFFVASWKIRNHVLFSYFLAAIGFILCLLLLFHSQPLISLGLNSTSFVKLGSRKMAVSKRSKAYMRCLKSLVVQPYGIHTVSFGTLCDYLVIVVSYLLMIMEAESRSAIGHKCTLTLHHP